MVEMKVLGSHEEWLRARTKIGGSDASAIFGMSPYKTNVELFKEKAYGIEPEDISDKHFSKAKGGKPKDKNIRGLAWVACRWAALVSLFLCPVENVNS